MLLRLLGAAFGAAIAWQLTGRLPLGLGFALAGPAFAVVMLATVLVIERFAPRPAPQGPRTASLTVRRIRDYPPRFPAFIATAGTAALVLLLVGTTKAGAPDDQGRPGRAFTRVCGDMTYTQTPWPGSFYSIPILVATGVCLVLALFALLAVTRRARLANDDGARRRAADVIVAAYGIAVLVPLAGCTALTMTGLSGTQCGLHTVSAGYVAAGVGDVAIVVALIYLIAVLLFGSNRDRTS